MKPLFWVDLEMTGLDEKTDHILEVAVAITNPKLEILEEYHRVVFQPPEVLAGMNDWCKKNHGESGLTAAVSGGTPLAQVEEELCALGKKYFKDDRIVLCGNSVGNDKRFLDYYMPKLAKQLHYRVIDVSSFKEVYKIRYGIQFAKKNAHRAIGDIHESIRELEHYLSFVQAPDKDAPKTPPVSS